MRKIVVVKIGIVLGVNESREIQKRIECRRQVALLPVMFRQAA
jgi:hypothetical protein